jgi:hypothetical protein
MTIKVDGTGLEDMSCRTYKQGSKRKALIVDNYNDDFPDTAIVEPLLIESMVLGGNGVPKSYFKRLCYFGCPELTRKGELKLNVENVYIERDKFVRFMYHLFEPDYNRTSQDRFYALLYYIRWLDECGLVLVNDDYFDKKLIDAYMTEFSRWLITKQKSSAQWVGARKMLSFVLKRLNRDYEVKNLPSIKIEKGNRKTIGLDVETELTPLLKAYFRAFKGFTKCFNGNTAPLIHPIFDEDLFNRQAKQKNWKESQINCIKFGFKQTVSSTSGNSHAKTWLNQFTRLSAMIIFAFTGQNTTPLLSLRHRDIVFDQRQAGKVYFNMDKDRAKYLSIDTSIGFSVHAKRFIDTWMKISIKLQDDIQDKFLFPYFSLDNTVKSLFNGDRWPQERLNGLGKKLGLAHVTPRILRQTKIDTLMKITEDIYLVSMSANNSILTLKSTYAHGQPKDHEGNLNASNNAIHALAKGEMVEDAVNKSKAKHFDILSDYDYKRLRENKKNPNESLTPVGVRCQNNKGGAAERIRKMQKNNGIFPLKEESFCTNFLGCFECPEHKLVALVDDIWLMLSFRDTLIEMLQYPTVNSLPKDQYLNLCQNIDDILTQFKLVSESNYVKATEKLKEASHPLYSNLYSLNDLLEVFK